MVKDSWDSLLQDGIGHIVGRAGTVSGTHDGLRVRNSTWNRLARLIEKLLGSRLGDLVIVFQTGIVEFSV